MHHKKHRAARTEPSRFHSAAEPDIVEDVRRAKREAATTDDAESGPPAPARATNG